MNEKPAPCAWPTSARRCRGCGATFRVLVATGAELVHLVDQVRAERSSLAAELAASVAARASAAAVLEPEPAKPDRAALAAAAEQAADEALVDDDRRPAAEVLAGWRVRLAAVRTEERMALDLPPTDEDLQLLELAARPVLAPVD